MALAAQVIILDLVFLYIYLSETHGLIKKILKKMNPQDQTKALATLVVSIGLECD